MAACSCKNLVRLGLSILAAGMLAGSSAGAALSGEHVDIALVINTDVSYSVDENEARFQREGAIAAFRNPDVVKAIQAGPLGRIAVTYLDFSSYSMNKIIAPWHIVHDAASAEAFADLLAIAPRTLGVQTSISSGLEMAEHLLEISGYIATKRVIDVSGDGPNNEGHLVDKVRDEIVAKGIVINGLPIMTPADQFDVYYLPDLDKYYAGCVIGGITFPTSTNITPAASSGGTAPSSRWRTASRIWRARCGASSSLRFPMRERRQIRWSSRSQRPHPERQQLRMRFTRRAAISVNGCASAVDR